MSRYTADRIWNNMCKSTDKRSYIQRQKLSHKKSANFSWLFIGLFSVKNFIPAWFEISIIL